jgi:hypothetical protein
MDRTKDVIPRIQPNLATTISKARILGQRTQSVQDDELAKLARGKDLPTVRTTFQSHWWFRENLGVGVDQAGMLPFPSTQTTFSSLPRSQRMASAGKVIGGFLEISAGWTAGSVWLGLMIEDTLVEEFRDLCVIDGTDGTSVATSFILPYDMGYDFAEGELIRAAFSTSTNWPNSTTDARGSFIIAYD